MSLMKRNKWIVQTTREQIEQNAEAKEISAVLGVSLPTAQLLVNRGCRDAEEARRFLFKETEHLHDPFLMKDMDKAVERILFALENEEKIVVFGDYDVDGVTSVSSLYLYLKEHDGNVSYYIPCRSGEGYGMSEGAVKKLADQGAELIITVDTGITAVSEALFARSLGVDVVITDHHECHGEMPQAAAVVNPRRPDCEYPFKELAGVGVVFKLLCALESALNPEDALIDCVRRVARDYGDLIAVGTVADVMPVRDENRLIISYGLSLIENSGRPGLIELIDATKTDSKYGGKRKITASFIGYTIAPRINAAGRIRDASRAVELFLAPDCETAAPIARELCDINKERQAEENKITEEAYAAIEACHDFEKEPVLVLDNETWHHGIIGIVASRITEKYGCPSILVSFEGSEDMGKGSGRSVKGMNLVEALSSCGDLLEKFGGHELAAGLTIRRENLAEFRKRINEYAIECFRDVDMTTSLEADCELSADDISMAQAKELYYLEPFGVSNPSPLFVLYNVPLADVVSVGGGKHTRLSVRIGTALVTVMCFRSTAAELDLYPGDTVDIMFGLDINEFMNQTSLQMIAKDVRLSEALYQREKREHEWYASLTDETLSSVGKYPEGVLPERQDFAVIYNMLKKEAQLEHEVFSLRALHHLLLKNGIFMPYQKLKAAVRIFDEMGLFMAAELDAEREIYSFGYIRVNGKIDLEKSNLLSVMRKNYKRNLSDE